MGCDESGIVEKEEKQGRCNIQDKEFLLTGLEQGPFKEGEIVNGPPEYPRIILPPNFW